MEPNFLFTVCPASFQEISTRILRAENLTLSTKILVHDANYLFFIYLINTIGLSMCSLHISWKLSFCGCHGAAWWYVQLWLHGLQMLPHCHLCKLYFRVTRLVKHRMLRKAVLDEIKDLSALVEVWSVSGPLHDSVTHQSYIYIFHEVFCFRLP